MEGMSNTYRMTRVVLLLAVIKIMMDSANLTMFAQNSDSFRLASMLADHRLVGYSFYACCATLVPLMVENIVGRRLFDRNLAFIACTGSMGGCILYIACAYAGQNTDLMEIRITYCTGAMICALLALSIAATVNEKMKIEMHLNRGQFGDSNRMELK